jgi:DNA-binding winged helix-turn-helix (wHTH) protein/predicted ATPase
MLALGSAIEDEVQLSVQFLVQTDEKMVQMLQENSTDAQAWAQELHFGPFRLEAGKQLWRGDQPIHLRRHSLALLRYLAERPGQQIKKEELLTQLWPGIYVSPTVVRVCVREIRFALGDDAKQPQFIETLGVLGYRFIFAVSTTTPPVLSEQFSVDSLDKEGTERSQLATAHWSLATDPRQLTTPFVGRERELTQLQTWYAHVQQGKRQVIFVSGEAGIGKTTLVDHFLAHASAEGVVRIGRGYCVEQAERGEAYLPLLQALQQLCHSPDGNQVVAILRRYAPLWLLQLSGVLEADELATLQHQVQQSSPQRRLREFVRAIEELASETTLILFLEDLQWSDISTLELIAYLAQRQEQARLLVIGTYRPTDTVLSNLPLRRVVQGMIGRGQCQELALEFFTQTEVEAYVTHRLAGSPLAPVLGPMLHRRTEGNALFVMHFMDYLLQQNLLVEANGDWELRVEPAALAELVPDHVHRLLVRQIEELSEETQQLLEVASVVGMAFTAGEVAAIINYPLQATETVCDELANQGRFIEVQGLTEWPDGSITVRYHFRHALYQQTLYHRIGLAQRVRWHRQLGEHFARVYGEHTQEIASELAFHFEHGRDYRRAILFRQQAGNLALHLNAYQKALGHGQAGLALLTHLPATAERGQLELKLRQIVNIALATSQGFTDDELEDSLRRTQQLCRELEDDPALVSVVIGLARLQLYRANRPAMEELARQEEDLVERLHNPLLLAQLHTHLVSIELARGRHTRAEKHYQQALGHYHSQAHRSFLAFLTQDPLVVALSSSGLSLSLSGQLDQGWNRLAQGLAHAEEIEQYVILANGLWFAVVVRSLRGEREEAWRLAKKMGSLSREHDFPLYARLGVLLQGGMAVQCGALEEGIAALTDGLAQYRAIGTQLFIPYFLSLLADGYRQQGKIPEALQAVHEALNLTATNFDVFWEAELYRQKGAILLAQEVKSQKAKSQSQKPEEAERYFLKAIEIARQQKAKLLELRAVMSLARLWQQQGRKKEARHRLAEIYDWFTEGLDTKNLQEAKALLAELA